MDETIKKVLDKLFDRIRRDDDIFSETDLSFDELIDKYYNMTEEKLPKNHICILRDVANNDKEFNKVIEFYRNFSEDSKRIDFNTPCENCDLQCCNDIDFNFNFFAATFVMDLWNRRSYYSFEVNNNLFKLFLKQFYVEENEIKFNEDKMMRLFIDYDLELLEKGLLKNDSLTNIKALIELKEVTLSLKTRFNNLNDKKLEFINQHILFINRKLEYFEKKYNLEKEILKIKNEKLDKRLQPLKDLWLPNAKISLQEVIKIGIDKGIWDENRNIITSRGSLYGAGKSLLASLSVALKNHCYSDSIHPDVLGSAFCQAFNINIDLKVDRPYKSFGSPNSRLTKRIRFAFLKM